MEVEASRPDQAGPSGSARRPSRVITGLVSFVGFLIGAGLVVSAPFARPGVTAGILWAAGMLVLVVSCRWFARHVVRPLGRGIAGDVYGATRGVRSEGSIVRTFSVLAVLLLLGSVWGVAATYSEGKSSAWAIGGLACGIGAALFAAMAWEGRGSVQQG